MCIYHIVQQGVHKTEAVDMSILEELIMIRWQDSWGTYLKAYNSSSIDKCHRINCKPKSTETEIHFQKEKATNEKSLDLGSDNRRHTYEIGEHEEKPIINEKRDFSLNSLD